MDMAATTTATQGFDGTPPRFELRHRLARALEWGQVSREEMAVEVGVGVTTIRNYLRGSTLPTRATVEVWARRCGVPFDWLLHGDADDEEGPETHHARRGSVRSGCISESAALAA